MPGANFRATAARPSHPTLHTRLQMQRIVPFPAAGLASALALAAALAAASPLAAQPAPHKRIQAVMNRPEFAHAHWGMEFYDIASGKVLMSHNGDRLFVPGSTTKVVTMATALQALGPDHRFRTRVYRTGPIRDGVVQGDIVLVASGDPNISGRVRDGAYAFIDQDHSYGGQPLPSDPLTTLREMAQQVAAKGIKGLTGQVIVDASLYREGARELGTRIVLSPMIVNDNVIDIVVTPGRRAGEPASVTVSPKTSLLTVQASITTADSGATAQLRTVEDSTSKDRRFLVLTGSVPVGAPSNRRWAVPQPSRFGEITFAEVLTDAGVAAIPRLASRVVDPAALAARYADSLLVAEHVSLDLTKEAVVLLKTSQNLHASNFPLLLGALKGGNGRTGFDIARDWLTQEGLDLDGAVQGDGAGGDAYFAPRFMTRLLARIWAKPWAREFKAALPTLGKDGTLAEIQVGAPAAGKVFAKTGTYGSYDPLNRRQLIHGKGLAGFFTSKSGREVAFAIYVNNVAVASGDPAQVAGQALGEVAAIAWETVK
ncbi:MAG: D-alanyl-D-alanine carboxypeptidase/D-alanyl-D-alanine-endopeptidase [Gemmatimonadetes bacterium SCN 70-22]|nr:MAG: D-alanyl-D-alanine carboxypeptidase/D-alanyl-D-alanine-endopeptidase [Gemmatimonadetes bacterium SCN 70-22]